MAVKIGHASIDENGKIASGKAGDQTGKEVCIRSWYNKGWGAVLRPKSAEVAEKSAQFVEAVCANANVGYDQNQRNTLYKQAQAVNFDGKSVKTKCECDCSALMHVAAIAGGANLAYASNGYTTRTMVSAFVASGDYTKLTDTKHLTSDKYLKRGDILVKEGSHTIMVLENGSGIVVEDVQVEKLTVDGTWGKDTTMKSQKVLGTTVDGKISNQSSKYKKYLTNASTSSWEFKLFGYKNGSQLIKAIQKLVGASVDGICGQGTIKAVQTFLKEKGYYIGNIDGYMGSMTVKAWQKYINSRL